MDPEILDPKGLVENSKKSSPKEILKQRFMYAIISLLNKRCKLTSKDGKIHQGRLSTYTSEGMVLLGCKNEEGLVSNRKFTIDNIISAEFTSISVVSHKKFKTDKEISKARHHKERVLEKFECEGEEEFFEQNNTKGWNQFEFNEKNFGVKSTYDEKFYTTSAVAEHELTAEQIRRAQLIEKELEGSKGDEGIEDDEEAQFGAVLGSGRYRNENKKSKIKRNKQNPPEQPEVKASEEQTTPKDIYKQVRKELVHPKLEKYSSPQHLKESVGSLDLMVVTPEVPEEVKKEFNKFKKVNQKNVTREEQVENFKDFSKKINSKIRRTWSRVSFI